MQEKLQKLFLINPLQNGVPKNVGSCQWCAIEGARVLLENAEPSEIPSSKGNEDDPIEDYVHPKYDYQTVSSQTRQEFFSSLKDQLKSGEMLLVSLEGQFDHAYIIYREKDKYHLIDPDRQVFIELTSGDDFIQPVAGWENVVTVDYSNGTKNPNSDSVDQVSMIVSFLDEDKLKEEPLPKYGDELNNSSEYNM